MVGVLSRFRLLLAAAGLVLAFASAQAQGPAFLSEFEDLPLMPGLVEENERGMVFDSPSGRIVEAVATGEVSAAAVRDFYAATLPQLGWQTTGDGDFRREAEELHLEITAEGARTAVKFSLSPAGVSAPVR